jgi:hypothetical protein
MTAVTEDQFNKLLDEYRSNQLKFLTTQRPEYQKAAKIAQTAVEDAIAEKQEGVTQQRRDMAHYVKSHAEGTKELFTLMDQAVDMRGDAQKMMDSYETSKGRYDAWSASPVTGGKIDYDNGYAILWRVGLAMLLFLVLMLVGFYNPQRYDYASSSGAGGGWFGFGATPSTPILSNYITPGRR